MNAFALTIFSGAFLLFQVQPLMARYILPWFGGSPAVWTTCMLFFQVFLLVGYAYAHAITRWMRPGRQALFHLILVAGALLFLPVVPGAEWKPVPSDDPTWRIMLLLTATVGLPYLVLAATSPLLQSWFSLTHPRQSPYRLYALSNAGSLLALITYPFVIEPLFTRGAQAAIWACGLVVYALLAIMCSLQLWRRLPQDRLENSPGSRRAITQAPSGAIQVLWLALSACASVILLGTTNKLCQDVAVIPFLWVMPLSLYLLTFILCFERAAWYRRKLLTLLLIPAFVFMSQGALGGDRPFLWQIVIYCGGLFVCCMVCHGEIYRLRPSPRYLTLFYLMIAAGGVLGGVFVTLIAPVVFRTYAELNWSLCLLGVLLMVIHAREKTAWKLHNTGGPIWPLLGGGTALLTAVILLQSRESALGILSMSRNFYGTLQVEEVCEDEPSIHGYILRHGNINHGAQFADPVKARMPITYFNELSGVGLAMNHLPRQSDRHIGVVGLGAGTLAAYGKPGDSFRFYEIDPEVHRLANQWFSYLKNSRARVETVLGDGRLSLEREPGQQFDLLVLDAFSGDAPPMHLLTLEAFETYLRHLGPDGVIAINISNNHVDFFPVIRGVADHFQMGMAMIPWMADPMPRGFSSSLWVLISRNRSFLSAQPIVSRARVPSAAYSQSPIVWNDDYASLFKILR
ncbi:MAG: spermidine synthase [Terrimicrobiaceae bacterium]